MRGKILGCRDASSLFFVFVVALGGLICSEGRSDVLLEPDGGSTVIFDDQPLGQSFTADRTHYWKMGLYIFDANAGAAPLDFTIDFSLYEGEGVDGTLLATQTIIVPGTGFEGFLDADFNDITLTLGELYSLVATQDTIRWAVGSSSDSYSGGNGIFSGNPTSEGTNAFRALPEPATGLMLIGATVGCWCLARRHRSCKSMSPIAD